MRKIVIIFYGPPGAGKGTQAENIAKKYNFFHFDTGKFIESIIRNPDFQKNKKIKKQKELFLSGKFVDPSWVRSEINKLIKKTSFENKTLVMSGSPRTEQEAFEPEGKGVADTLIKYYGASNILIIFLTIPVYESVRRNSKRGRAGLDEPPIIKIRCKEYKKRTFPVISKMKERGIKVIKINGLASQEIVSRNVLEETRKFLFNANKN